MMREVRQRAIVIFFLVLGILTLSINSWNAKYFGLQNATVAGLVQNKTFALVDQVIPGFNLVEGTETFRFGKHVYPMKQPGPTILGALVYYPLYQLNFTYANHFDYVSHLVTFGTSSIMMAITAVLLYVIVREITRSHEPAFWAAVLFPFSTLIWPYAGVSHHDIYGVFFGSCAIFLYWRAVKSKLCRDWVLSGILSTLMLFFTMLPLTLPLTLFVATIFRRNLQDSLKFGIGMVLGFLPNAIFNLVMFDNPFLPPNLAGKVSDTMPLFLLSNFLSKLDFYLLSPNSALMYFAPICLFGVAGLWLYKAKNPFVAKVLLMIPLMQLLHISSMETIGGYQYGPRYLLPILMPLFVGIGYWLSQKHSKLVTTSFVITAIYSICVALIGAVTTVMYPMPGPFAPIAQLRLILSGDLPIFRMFIPALMLILLSAGISYFGKRATSKSPN